MMQDRADISALSDFRNNWPFCCLGFATCLLPFFGPGLLLFSGLPLLVIISLINGQRKTDLAWAGPLLVLLLLWLVAELIGGLSLTEFDILLSNFSSRLFRASVFEFPNESLSSIFQFCRYLLCFSLVSIVARDATVSRYFVRGILLSLPAVALVAALETFGLIAKSQIPNMTEFWSSIGRWPITFSDPNAAGVALFLVVVLVWALEESLRIKVLVLVLTTLLALLAGSRSFFLGTGLFFFFNWGRAQARRWVWLSLALFGLLLAHTVLWNWVATYREFYSGPGVHLVSGLARVADSLRLDRLSESFSSRLIFWRIGALIFLDHLWFGVGPGQFAQYVPEAALRLGISLGTWTDNANNFYLSVGAELGVVGLLALVWVLAARRLGNNGIAISGLFAFLVLLLFGPHLVFDEVSVLSGVLIGLATTERLPPIARRWPLTAVVVCFPAVFVVAHGSQRGLFAPEVDPKGEFRWTRSAARIVLPCDGGAAKFTIQNPFAVSRSQNALLTTGEEKIAMLLATGEERLLTLRCPVEPVPEEAWPQKLLINLTVSSPIIPETRGYKGDSRPLGVKLRSKVR